MQHAASDLALLDTAWPPADIASLVVPLAHGRARSLPPPPVTKTHRTTAPNDGAYEPRGAPDRHLGRVAHIRMSGDPGGGALAQSSWTDGTSRGPVEPRYVRSSGNRPQPLDDGDQPFEVVAVVFEQPLAQLHIIG